MFKKLLAAFALAMLMIFSVSAAALAKTNWKTLKPYFETVRAMEGAGELARWSPEDRLKLVQAMAAAGLAAQDENLQAALDGSLPLERRGEAAAAVVAQRYGDEYFDSEMVEKREFPPAKRTKKEKAAYRKWSDAFWEQWNARPKQPLTEGDFYLAVMNHFISVGDLPREQYRAVTVAGVWDETQRRYTVTASINKDVYLAAKHNEDVMTPFEQSCGGYVEGDTLCFQLWLDEAGGFLGVYDAGALENRVELSLEQGQVIAEKALLERLKADKTALEGLSLRSFYSEGGEYSLAEGRFLVVCTYSWTEPNGDARYLVEVDARTGQVNGVVDWRESTALKEKEEEWVAELWDRVFKAGGSDLTNGKGQFFWGWSLEDKAAWSAVARPIVLSYIAENEAFAQYLEAQRNGKYDRREWPLLISLTQYAYGTPDGDAISQAQAFSIAREAALERGAK